LEVVTLERKPAVSGIFYASNLVKLREQIQKLFLHVEGPGKIPEPVHEPLKNSVGVMLPHAGYVCSGPIAADGLAQVSQHGVPSTIVLLGPSHTGMGKPVSVWDRGEWQTPFGTVQVDHELSQKFLDLYDYARVNYDAHVGEHSLEVQLPLLQFVYGQDFRILPIAMMDQRKETAREMASVFQELKKDRPLLFVASSDMNHYQAEQETLEKDDHVLQAVLEMDVEKMYAAISEYEVSMCGFGPVATLLLSGLGTPRLVKHVTSAKTCTDQRHVVGYASVVFDSHTP